MPHSQKVKLVTEEEEKTNSSSIVEFYLERRNNTVCLMADVDGEERYIAELTKDGMKLISDPELPDEMMDKETSCIKCGVIE